MEARQEGRELVVAVQDDGLGISCDALAHVFDIFRQVDESLERSQGGLGIGLTVVRRLVELHGGSINAQSEGLGKGSAFVVRLPVAADASPARATGRIASEASMSKRRILVVDDNRDSGDTLGILLRAKGYEVRMARDGLEAIEVAGEFYARDHFDGRRHAEDERLRRDAADSPDGFGAGRVYCCLDRLGTGRRRAAIAGGGLCGAPGETGRFCGADAIVGERERAGR